MPAGFPLRQRPLFALSWALLLILLSVSMPSLSAEIFPHRLVKSDHKRLETLACREPYNLNASRIVALGNARSSPTSIFAEVLCATHDNYKMNLIHHVVFCEKHRAIWKCPRSELAIRMRDDTRALIYFEEDIDYETAYNVVTKLAESKYYQGEDIPKPTQSICNIHHYFNDEKKLVPEVYAATCGTQQVLVSTWCPQQECPRIIGKRDLIN